MPGKGDKAKPERQPVPDKPDRVRAGGWVLVDGVWQIEQK